jgi:O-antigen ligase
MALTALRMIRYNPFGVGLGQYVLRMNAYDVTQDGLTYHFRFPVHNAYLLLCAEQGIWVLVTYLVLFCLYYVEVFKLVFARPGWPRVIGLAFAAGMVAVHLHLNLEINYVMTDIHEWFAMGMVLMVLRHLQRREAAPALAAPAGPDLIAAVRRKAAPAGA